MPVYRHSELRHFLMENGLNPKKVLSQNFLTDGNILKKIVKTADLASGKLILEVGSGPGALTELLMLSGGEVIAVEKDEKLAALLSRFSDLPGSLTVYNEDILKFPLDENLREKVAVKGKAKVIANLPYHITTPILERLLPLNDLFSHVIVMVQEEVARRLTARPGNKDYGSFTVYVNYYSRATYAFKVARECFYPAPKVHSAVVCFALHPTPADVEEDKFFEMTRCCFQMRRKMVKKSLSRLFLQSDVEKALADEQLPITARPEELSFDNFLHLYHSLYSRS